MVLAVDLGQSGTRLRWADGEHVSARAKQANESPLEVLRAVFEEVVAIYGETLRNQVVALSLTAINGQVPDPEPYGELSHEFFGAVETAVMDDGLAGYIGALGTEEGVALSVGSGVVAIGGRRGKFAHADGLGHIFGDEGGGFWLGKHGLERALATRQGRDSDKDLLDFLKDEVSQFDELGSKVDAGAQSLCIATAKKVLEAADENIPSAIMIRDRGATQLAKTVSAAWVSTGGLVNESLSFSLLGGLSRNSGYRESIRCHVVLLLPQVHLMTPRGNHLDGATAIATSMKSDSLPLLRWWRQP